MSEIVERFSRVRRDQPDRPLIHVPATGAAFTAEDLWRLAGRQASRLEALGLGVDHLVLSAAGNRPEAIALWLACRRLGIALMPVDAGTPAAGIGSLAGRFGAAVAIVPASMGRIDSAGAVEPFVEPLAAVRVHGVEPRPDLHAGAAALKLTSGTSGLPKATFTRESQLVADTLHIVEAMDVRPADCQIAVTPLSHAYAIGNVVMPLLLQGTSIVLREGFVPHQLHADATACGARVFAGVPFMFGYFVQHAGAARWPRALERLISAGAPLDPAMARAFHAAFGTKIHSFYGASETGGITFDDEPEVRDVATVGRPLPGVQLTFRPDDGAPPEGGRVHVAGDAVSSGYVGDGGEDDAFDGGGFLTGDLGTLDGEGRLVLTGRASTFINLAGKKVQPEEVERVLREAPGVRDARVFGLDDPVRGQQVVAAVVATPGVSPPDLRGYCGGRLAAYQIPRTIVLVDAVPLTERGKTDRAKLEAIVRARLA